MGSLTNSREEDDPSPSVPTCIHVHQPHVKTLPYCLVGQPASITVVVSVCKRGLQLPWRCHDRRVLQTHPLGIGEGQTVAVVGRPVVKYHTCREAQCFDSDPRCVSYT